MTKDGMNNGGTGNGGAAAGTDSAGGAGGGTRSGGGTSGRVTGRARLDRAIAWLGVAALLAAATTVLSGDFNFFHVRGWGIAVTAGLGVLALLAGLFRMRLLALLAAAGYLAAAGTQLVQLDGYLGNAELGVLGGNSSTVGLWLALAIGLVVLALTPAKSTTEEG